MLFSRRSKLCAVFLAALLVGGCGLYDGLVNEPVADEPAPNRDDNGESCEGCRGLCIDDRCRAASALSAGARHTCALLDEGEVACWGENGRGQLGVATTAREDRPVMVEGVGPAVELSAGWQHTCAVLEEGQVVCWGSNAQHQLGRNSQEDWSAEAKLVVGLEDMVGIAAGYDHNCGVDSTGEVFCWGGNLLGQVGEGGVNFDETNVVPRPVSARGDSLSAPAAEQIAAGWFVSSVVDVAGGLWVWGDNQYGQLAESQGEDHIATPHLVLSVPDASSIAAGWRHICALDDGGEVLCWGDNQTRQLGRGSGDFWSYTPLPVSGLPSATIIEVGWGGHSCAGTDEGLYCWGDNAHGQVGDGNSGEGAITATATLVLDKEVRDIAAGLEHSCALSAEGEVYCWGANHMGQLGHGSTTEALEPGQVQ